MAIWIKATIGLIGIVLTIIGSYVKQAERYLWIVRLISPAYPQTLSTYEEMLKATDSAGASPVEISNAAPGFREILTILEDHNPELKHRSTVLRIKISSTLLAIGSYNPNTAVY